MFGRGKLAIRRDNLRSGLVSSKIALDKFGDLPRSHVFEIDSTLPPYPLEHRPWNVGIRFWYQYNVIQSEKGIEISAAIHAHDLSRREHFLQTVKKNHGNKTYTSSDQHDEPDEEDPEAEDDFDGWLHSGSDEDSDWSSDGDSQMDTDEGGNYEHVLCNISSHSHRIPKRPQTPRLINLRHKTPATHARRLVLMDSSYAVTQYLMALNFNDDDIDKLLDVWATRIENLEEAQSKTLNIFDPPKQQPFVVTLPTKVHT
jgi:hypothetical protein